MSMSKHTPAAMIPEYITRKQAAALLSCNDQTISKWIRDGHLPAYRLGPSLRHASVRIKRRDVLALMEKWAVQQ